MRASSVVTLAPATFGMPAASSRDGKALPLGNTAPSPSTVFSGTKLLPMSTTWRSEGIFSTTFSLIVKKWPQSMKSTVASVSLRPWSMASWPSVVYTVVMGMPSWYIAWADVCHSADVSARIAPTHWTPDSFFSFTPDKLISPLTAASTLAPISAYVSHSTGPLVQNCFLPSILHSEILRVPMHFLVENFSTLTLKRFIIVGSLSLGKPSGTTARLPLFFS
mmetsp:Transcript_73989/g.217109  ORF Transcript_73989/g.217109 Transcript_73989/m.217109 type:complete len:221 (+) Transcript_73989:1534-2196(+)